MERSKDLAVRNQRSFSLEFKRQVVEELMSEEAAVRDRVGKLERLVGKLTLENEVLTRGWQYSLSRSQRNGRSSGYGDVSASPSGGGVR